jgi:PKD repeat protein
MKTVTMRLAIALLFVLQFCNLSAQLPNGSIAPDFTATDLNGVSHNLYSLLDAGKTVVLDISATWCGPCWSYHESGNLENLYNQYGPNGTNEMMVFLVEGDASTGLSDLNGTGSNTAGNWVAGTPYPILDNAGIANSYQIAYFPTVYVICPNRTLTIHDQETTAQLYAARAACPPMATVANFITSTTAPCVGSPVTFTDQTNGNPTSWSWSFSPNTVTFVGGTTASSQNPSVQFDAAGPYSVTLIANGPYGSDNEIKTNFITPNSTVLNLPIVENFDGATFPPVNWTVQNSDGPSAAWGAAGAKGLEKRVATGNTGSTAGCVGLNCFDYSDTTKVDNLISGKINLVGAAAPKLTFKRAYKTYVSASNPQFYRDELKVYVSTDCGVTWGNAVYFKKGAQLASNGNLNTSFSPNVAADWASDIVDLSAFVGQTVNVKFEFVNRYGNNLYIDDINIANTAAPTATVSIASNVASNTICAGTSVTFTATPVNGGTPSYQWMVNGVNTGTNAATFTTANLTNGQTVTCVMTSSVAGTSQATSNSVSVTVNTVPAMPIVSGNSPICTGNAINLTTQAVNGAAYLWSGPSGFTSSLQNPSIASATAGMAGSYSLVLTVNGCSSNSGSTALSVTPSVTPASSMAITSGGNPTCVSQQVTFTANGTDLGSDPFYQWTVNGTNVGTNSSSFTPASISDGSVISCLITSNAACTTAPTAGTNSISMAVTSSVVPSLTITSNSATFCAGSTAVFSPSPVNGGSAPSYQWKVNGVVVSSNSSYSSTSLNTGDVVTCVMVSNSSCASPSTATSNSVIVSISPMVTPSIQVVNNSVNNSICQGEPVIFSSTVANEGNSPTYDWLVNGISQGASTPQFQALSIVNNDVVSCVLTSSESCVTTSYSSSNSTTMMVNPSPNFGLSSNSPICTGNDVNLSSTTLVGATYAWTGPDGFTSVSQNPVLSAATLSMAGSYSLIVTMNGCSTTNTLSILVNTTPPIPVISQSGMVLTSSSSNGNQWSYNGVEIAGATSSTFNATQDGYFSVAVTQDGCTASSSSYYQSSAGMEESAGINEGVIIFPNPSAGLFNIKFSQKETLTYSVEVSNINGQIVDQHEFENAVPQSTHKLDLQGYSRGMYLLHINNGVSTKIVKVSVQ